MRDLCVNYLIKFWKFPLKIKEFNYLIFLEFIFSKFSIPKELPNSNKTSIVMDTLEKSIHTSIFNFNKLFFSLDLDSFISDNSILSCRCAHSCVKDKDHGQILIWNFKIIDRISWGIFSQRNQNKERVGP